MFHVCLTCVVRGSHASSDVRLKCWNGRLEGLMGECVWVGWGDTSFFLRCPVVIYVSCTWTTSLFAHHRRICIFLSLRVSLSVNALLTFLFLLPPLSLSIFTGPFLVSPLSLRSLHPCLSVFLFASPHRSLQRHTDGISCIRY